MRIGPQTPGLLVSVRSVQEAEAALQGGADLIDVKEPNHGSLGCADNRTIGAVLKSVAGRRPVSAALGELVEDLPALRDPRLAFVKWGLAGCATSPSPERKNPWQTRLNHELAQPGNPQTVLVAYADWQCAQAPPIDDVIAFACKKPGNVLLIDTHCKEPGTLRKDHRPTLLDWLSLPEVRALCAQCRSTGVRVALAGSLGLLEIKTLYSTAPDWFAVRGAVCDENQRQGTVAVEKVRQLVDFLAKPELS